MLAQIVGLLKLVLELLCTIRIQRRELYLYDITKYTFNIGLCHDTCELISFKLVVLDITELYSTPVKVKGIWES